MAVAQVTVPVVATMAAAWVLVPAVAWVTVPAVAIMEAASVMVPAAETTVAV